VVSEKQTNWSEISEEKAVTCFGRKRVCSVAKPQASKIRIVLGKLEATIEIPPDCQVYQFIRSQQLFAKGVNEYTVIGRGIGLIKEDKVIEEKFINALENTVEGFRA